MPIKFDAEDKSLSDIFTGQEKYKIPRYQRPYSWTTDEVSDLWNDLKEEDSTFLGSFVFNYEKYNDDKFVEVIDGQQRLITLMILLAVLRDLYKELGDEEGANLTQNLISHKDQITRIEDYRLKCGDSLNNFFMENIQKKNSDILSANPKKKELKAIKENYKFLKEGISSELQLIKDKTRKIEYLNNLKKKIFDFKIIWIKIENDEDAYSIFETVNARGADLTAADLLKNYLFSKLPRRDDGIDSAKDTWSMIENNVENTKGPLNVSKFIRYFWLSKYSFTPEKKLYKEVKKTISDPSNFLNDLLRASDYYYKIANSSTGKDIWSEEFEDRKIGRKIHESLNGLRMMGITQCYSLLFCLLMNKDKIDFDLSGIFQTIEKYHFAYSAICKQPGNIVERVYFNTAKEIQDALKISNINKRKKYLGGIFSKFRNKLEYPPKSLFMERFMDIEYKDYSLIIYILSNIERYKNFKEINREFDRTSIEHILPRDPSEWNLSKKDIKEYVNKLGNLTLIAEIINGSMGNKSLKGKSELFEKSQLSINKDLLEKFKNLNYKWGEKEINERQKELAEYAYNYVWKFK